MQPHRTASERRTALAVALSIGAGWILIEITDAHPLWFLAFWVPGAVAALAYSRVLRNKRMHASDIRDPDERPLRPGA